MKSSILIFVILFSSPLFAQSSKEKLQTYDSRLKALAKDDWDGRVKLAQWCHENGLETQAKNLLNAVIKAQPDNADARKLLGYVKYQDKWILESDLEKIREKEKEKELKEKGYVNFKGQWVLASDVPFLEKGMVKNGDIWVTKEEKDKIDKGYLLVDGEWLSPKEAENAKKGLYKVDNKWVALTEADQYHSDWKTPWKLPTAHFILYTNMDRKSADTVKDAIERTYSKLYELFKVDLKDKPAILAIATDTDYQNFVGKFSPNHSTVWGGSMGEAHPERPGIVNIPLKKDEKFFVPLYVGHAVAHVYLDRIAKTYENVPIWVMEGVANYVSRCQTPELKKWTIEMLNRRGNMDPLPMYTTKLELSSTTTDQSQKSLLEAGLLVCYFLESDNEPMKKAFHEVVALIPKQDRKKIDKAVEALLAKPAELERDFKSYLEANK